VQKENFLESLDKRRSLIQADIDADKSTFSLLRAHTRAVSARVARLKKERLSQEIKAQQQQYAAAAKKLSGEVASIQQVVAALDSRVRNIDSEVAPLAKAEFDGMQESLQASAAAPAAAKPAASAAKPAAAAAAKPAAKAAEKN
jgi:peptidoglycan hydrolase CwlO-like protein